MDVTTQTDIGGHVVYVTELMGRLLKRPTPVQPTGEDKEQWLRIFADFKEGISIGWTPYRPADLTGQRPVWYEVVNNVGDVDTAPVMIPMGPRHFSIHAIAIPN